MQKQKSKAGRLVMIAMFMTLSLVTSLNVMAQTECLGICEQNMERCLREGNSLLGPDCVAQYELCANACISSANAVLE